MAPRRLLGPQDELENLYRKSASIYAEKLNRVIEAVYRQDDERHQQALGSLAETIGATMAVADLMGRRRVLLETDAALRGNRGVPAGMILLRDMEPISAQPIIPHVPFAEAIEDMIHRLPIGISEQLVEQMPFASLGEIVSEIYSKQRAFAFAAITDQAVTQRVQDFIASAISRGVPVRSAAQVITGLAPLTEAHAATVYRTNLSNAYSAGRIQQASRPEVRQVAPALKFVSARDADVRRGREGDHGEDHLAMDGVMAAADDPIWQEWSPPLGYNCRCAVRMVSYSEAERSGAIRGGRVRLAVVPSAAAKHPNFGRRPDIALYQGAIV